MPSHREQAPCRAWKHHSCLRGRKVPIIYFRFSFQPRTRPFQISSWWDQRFPPYLLFSPTFSSCLHELLQQTMSDSTPQQSGGLFTDISTPQPRMQPVLTIVMHEKQPNLEDSTFIWNRQQSQITAGPVIIVVMCHSLVHISLIANCLFLTSDLWYFCSLTCFNFTLSIFY